MRRIKRLRCRHWRLLGATLALTVCLITGSSLAADLVIDGTTYTVNSDVSFNNVYVGNVSTGTLNQTGGTNTLSGLLTLGNQSGSSGTYNLSGGSLSTISAVIGNGGNGTFTQTVGTSVQTGNLYLGYSSDGTGTYNQTGGTNTMAGIFFLGFNSGSSGTYNLSGGSLSAGFGFVGYQGVGVFNQSGGILRISNNLQLGFSSGSSGTYNLSGGSLFTSTLYVGKDANGIFNQSGGSATIEKLSSVSGLYLGYYSGRSGTYNLSGGSLSAPAETIGVLVGGVGIFNQSGGTNTVTDVLTLGYRNGSSGTYNLSGGSLLTDFEAIGYQGLGAFNQSGGSNMVTSDLILGDWSAGNGAYNLSGGSLTARSEIIGSFGVGVFNQSGGTNTVTGDLRMGDQPGRRGAYTLSGGSLFTTNTVVGNGGSGTFTQTGGSNTLTGSLYLGNTTLGGSGIYKLDGGSLLAANEFISPNGAFIHSGGTNTVDNLYLDGPYELTGTGVLSAFYVEGNLINGGIVAPGHSVGTMAVNGSYTQTAKGTLEAEIASPTSYDKVNIIGNPGTATLSGTLKPVLLGGFKPGANQLFPGVISATGGVTGTFSTLANQFISPILSWQALYMANTVDLLAKADFSNSALNLTHNQYAVGVILNGVANGATGDLGNVLNTIATLPINDQIAKTYQQISPDKAAALSALAFAGANLQKRILSERITNLRFGSREIGDLGGQPGSFNFNGSRAGGVMLAYNSSSLAGVLTSEGKASPASPESRWGLYLDPALVLGAQQSSVNQTGFTFTIAGFNAGADYRVRDDLLLGLASGYSYTDANFRCSGGNVQANAWPLTAYVAYLPQSFYAYGSLGYALNLFNLERDINFGDLNRTAKSSTTGNQFNAYGEAGYDLKVKRLVVTPVLSLAYSKLWVGGFTEDGADSLNLKVSTQNAQSLQTGVGGKIAVPINRNSVKVVPQVYATYQHEYSNSSRGLNARLSQADSTFTFQTEHPHRNFAMVGANVNILTQKNLKVQLDYNAEVGRGTYTAHYVSAGVRWEF